jgi:hypothetical protein
MTEEQNPVRKRAKAAKRAGTTPADPVEDGLETDGPETDGPDETVNETVNAATPTLGGETGASDNKTLGDTEAAGPAARRGVTIPLPNVRIPAPTLPRLPLPSQHTVVMTAYRVGDTVRKNAPTGDELLYYGGLGALAVFGAIDWPVAAAIGAGVWIARHHRGDREAERTSEHARSGAADQPGRTGPDAEPEPALPPEPTTV